MSPALNSTFSEYDKSVLHVNDKIKRESMPSPIAFAVSVWEGTIKCVDYYMTWRGIKVCAYTLNPRPSDSLLSIWNTTSESWCWTRYLHLPMRSYAWIFMLYYPEVERKIDFLEAEFRRLVRKLDDEYSRITYVFFSVMHSTLVIYFRRSLRKHENLSPIKRKFDNDSDSPQLPRKSRPHSKAALSVNEGKGDHISLWDFAFFLTSGFIEESIIPGLPEPPV